MYPLIATTVCLIACHGGPADHFATFAEDLLSKGYQVQIYATGPALKKLQDRNIQMVIPFSLENISEEDAATQLAKKCAGVTTIITDVGHLFDIPLQDALKSHAPKATRYAYYDNPESYVPGGYSATAAKVMQAAQGVLFANANLAKTALYEAPGREVCLAPEKKIGIGYYPISQAEKIAKRRISDHNQLRSALFSQYPITDRGQKVLVYAGGNNTEYFSEALPAFLRFIREASLKIDLSDYVVLLQQHPGAKEKNFDAEHVCRWAEQYGHEVGMPQFFISKLNSDDAQVVADAMIYYQTSMGPGFVLAGIPTIQVGHNTNADILVKNGLCPTVTTADGLIDAFTSLQKKVKFDDEIIKHNLGIRNWQENLERAVNSSPLHE
jgi:hypothetical protein